MSHRASISWRQSVPLLIHFRMRILSCAAGNVIDSAAVPLLTCAHRSREGVREVYLSLYGGTKITLIVPLGTQMFMSWDSFC